MSERENREQEEIFSKIVRAGRRTYFFDVRATRAQDYYLTITESKKFTNDDGSFYFKKHKIYLYKEDFSEFKETLNEMIQYIHNEKGDEVISDRHQANYQKEEPAPVASETATTDEKPTDDSETAASRFSDIDFDDI